MKRLMMLLIPLLILAVGVLGAWAMYLSRPQAETRIPDAPPPVVRVQNVELVDVQLRVESQGTVVPRTESTLTPQVSGRVIDVASSFVAGGFFEKGDVLVRIEPFDFQQAVIQAEAQVAQAKLRIEREQAEAEVARREWESLDGGEAPSLTLREPQLAEARAALRASEAALEQARRNLERTTLRAPYAGRVRGKNADVGQFVTAGSPLATIYAVDYAEVRLPLADDELAFIDVPYAYRGERGRKSGPEVILRADFAGSTHQWRGRVVRTEGEIDPRSRLVHVVARVPDPYGRGPEGNRPPLAVGLYVEAEILGDEAKSVAIIPRSALRSENQVLVVDAEDRIRFRQVDVLRTLDTEVTVREGLRSGERLCLSSLPMATDGMPVVPRAEASPDDAAESSGSEEVRS